MIVFDLKCGTGHVFEACFSNSTAYDDQKKRNLITCPICGANDVTKAPMAPNISSSRSREKAAADAGPAPELAEQVRDVLSNLRTKIESEFDYVGNDFAEEARKIHYGEVEARSIYGEATLEETKALCEEGVDLVPLPFSAKHNA